MPLKLDRFQSLSTDKMEFIVSLLLLSPALVAGSLHSRIDNGLARTPQMGYVAPAEGRLLLTGQMELVQLLLMLA